MKLTTIQIRKLIKEELEKTLELKKIADLVKSDTATAGQKAKLYKALKSAEFNPENKEELLKKIGDISSLGGKIKTVGDITGDESGGFGSAYFDQD